MASPLPAGRLITHLTTRFPEVRWRTEPFEHARTLDQIRDRSLDLAVWFRCPDRDERPPARLDRLRLFDEPVWVAVATASPLAGRDDVTLPELADRLWIARPEGPLRRLLDGACRTAGFEPRIAHVSENNRVIRSLVAADVGGTLAAPGIPAAPDITVVPLVGVPQLRYDLVWDTERLSRRQADRVRTAVRDWYRADALRSPRYWSWLLAHR